MNMRYLFQLFVEQIQYLECFLAESSFWLCAANVAGCGVFTFIYRWTLFPRSRQVFGSNCVSWTASLSVTAARPIISSEWKKIVKWKCLTEMHIIKCIFIFCFQQKLFVISVHQCLPLNSLMWDQCNTFLLKNEYVIFNKNSIFIL